MHDFNTCHHLFIYHEKLICAFASIWNKNKNTLTDVADDTHQILMIFIEISPRLCSTLGPEFLSISFQEEKTMESKQRLYQP